MAVSDGSDDFVSTMSREEHERGAKMREELLGWFAGARSRTEC